MAQLVRDSRLGRRELDTLAATRLKSVLINAMAVPHYAEQMRKAGFDPRRDFRSLKDLSVLPITKKADIKASPSSFVQAAEAGRLDRYFSDRTSGSTGIPLTVYRSPRERAFQMAKWLRVLFASGYRPTQKVLSYTSPGRLAEGHSFIQRLGLFRRRAVDYTLPPEVLTDALIEYQPNALYGVRTSLLSVAEELQRRNTVCSSIDLVIAGGEVIDPQTREMCKAVFGTEITETYGTVEMGVMAHQVKGQAELRLIEDCTLFEFLDEQGNPAKPGEPARIVVTDLHGRLMPFIRYDQGDLVTFSVRQLESGETVRVIDRIIGRQDDVVSLPNGRSLTYLDFYEIMDVYPGVGHFRITQHSEDRFLLEVVADESYFQAITPELLSKLKALSTVTLYFDMRLVDRIAPDPSGKRRMLVSKVLRSAAGGHAYVPPTRNPRLDFASQS